VLLVLGDRRYDVSRRALVLAAVVSGRAGEKPPLDAVLARAERALAEGADALAVPARDVVVAAVHQRYDDVPIGVAAANRDRLVGAMDAGATLAIVRANRVELFDAVARATGSIVLVGATAETTARAGAAGISPERVIVGLHRRSDVVSLPFAPGHVVAVDALFCDRTATVVVVAAALVRGCRMVATTEVRAARRTVDVMAALVEAGEEAAR
jgi:hypothetical protein